MIASAVSAGSRPPRSSPIGPAQPVELVRVTPASSSRARRSAWVLREPTAPDVPAAAMRAPSTIAGSSNFTSWVSTATASAGPRPISSASSSGQPTMSRSTSGNRASVANAARPSMTTVS